MTRREDQREASATSRGTPSGASANAGPPRRLSDRLAKRSALSHGPATSSPRLFVSPDCRAELAAAGLTSFEAVMTTTNGRCLRALADRENWRIEFHGAPPGGLRAAFLKKHHVRTLLTRLAARFQLAIVSAGEREAANIRRVDEAGVPTMRLLAWGARLDAAGLLESFLLTEELTGFTQLDHFLRAAFAPRPAAATSRRSRRFVALLRQVAELAARFHRAGFNHRDLYGCHFFVRETATGQFSLRLIDLQRVQRRRRWRRRWIVKDLAQLAYSAPRDRVSCTDRLAFMRFYFGVRRLGPAHKRLIREVLDKAQLMERQLGAHP